MIPSLPYKINKILFSIFLLVSTFAFSQNCTVNANVNQTICVNESLSLVGNANGVSGSSLIGWSQISGPSVSITTPTQLTTTVTGFTAGNTYVFRLSAKCSDGSTIKDDITVVVSPITIANAGPDVKQCPGTYALNGNTPIAGETGEWSIVGGNGAGVSISNVNLPNASYTISGSSSGSTTLRWSFTNLSNGCNSYDDVVITSPGGINPVSAGSDQNLSKCYSSTQNTNLSGTFGGNGLDGQSGVWTVVSGPSVPTFSDSNNNETRVSGLQQGTYVFRWTVSGPCANGFDEVTVTVPAPTADITKVNGNSQSFCDGSTSALLVGTVPSFINETVFWTQVSGPTTATIESPTTPSTNVLDLLGVGTYVFRYTISNAITGCQSSGDYTLIFANTPTINAGGDQLLDCLQTEVTIPITQTGDGKTGWRIVSGPINPNYPVYPTPIKEFSGNTLLVEGLIEGGAYDIRVLKEAPVGNLCTTVTDDVKIVVSIEPSGSNGGSAQVLDCSATSAVLAGNIPENGIGRWSQFSGPNQAIIANPFNAATTVSGMTNGLYLFVWTITGGPNCINTQGIARVIVSEVAPDLPDAGADQSICFGTPVALNATVPKLNEKGKWTVVSGVNYTISDIEDPTAFFTGLDPNTAYTLRWTIINSCNSAYDEVTITTNNSNGPVGANAGTNACLPSGTTTITLSGNDPSPGIGTWKQISGPNAVITNPNLYNTSVTGVVNGNYEFEWSIESGGCAPSSDSVVISVSEPTTVANAGPNQSLCQSTTTMAANTPVVGTGFWTLLTSEIGPIIVDRFDPNTEVTNLTAGTWLFEWTIVNGVCERSTSATQINVQRGPSVSNAGPDQEKCDASPVIMDANFPLRGGGTWSLVSGPNNPTYSDVHSNNTTINGLISGTYIFRWTISTGINCPDTFDDVTIIVRDVANAGSDIIACDQGAVLLTGTIGTSGTWTFVSGPGSPIITQVPASNSASITNLSKGTSIFRYTIDAIGSCPNSTDDVSVIITGEPSTSNAGPDQILCNNGQIQLDGNIPLFGKGKWSILAGPTSGTFIPSDSSPNAIYTNAPSGVYVFQWTISDAGCQNTDQVRVENNETPTNPDAGPDQDKVCGSTTILAANTPVFGVGTWSQISGPSAAVFSSVVLPDPIVSNLIAGDYVFEWSISNGTVCPIEKDLVNVKVFTAPTKPDAGPDQNVCASATTVQLAANKILIGSGKWTQVSGPIGTFSDDTSNTSLFTINGPGSYTLEWTASNLNCSATDKVIINVDSEPTIADAGLPISNCKFAKLILNANNADVGSGFWTQISGPTPVVFVVPTSPKTEVLGVVEGVYVFEWTISNGVCPPSSSQVQVTITAEATIADAGIAQTICNTNSVTMAANNPVEGDGLWSFVINPGTAVITDPTSPITTITGLTDGLFRLRWTITNSCGSNFDEVNIEKLPDLVTTNITPNQTICVGGTATFTTTASGGNGSYSYQWQSSSDNVNWSSISGENTNQYVVSNNLATGTYYYRVEVATSCSTIYSNSATLQVVNDPIFTLQPVGSTICSGDTYTMFADASGGTGTISYQWREATDGFTFTDIAGATSSSYTTVPLTANRYYTVKITQAASGCENTSFSTLVNVATLTAQPVTPAAICVGGTASMSVAASLNGGSGSLSYQWQSSPNGSSSWTDISVGTGFTTTNYTTENLTTTTWFRCKITSSTTSCTLFSNGVQVLVVPDPTITVQPNSTTICVGGSVVFSVQATNGTPSLTYQWQSSTTSGSGFTDIPGATLDTYTTRVINAIGITYYQVVVSAAGNGCNSVTSSEASVTAVADPIITDQPDDTIICDGTSTTLSVTATGGVGTLLYLWQSSPNGTNFTTISGATSNTYTTPTLNNDTFYRVIVTQAASGCRVNSTNAKVSVAKISVQPTTPLDICVGGIISVSVTTTVVPGTSYAYQWQSSTNGTVWNDETNASASTANFTSDALNTTTQFRCVVTTTNPSCTLTSTAVTATVVPDPTIDTQPQGGTICDGGNFSMSVQASNGTPSLTYQWQSSTTLGGTYTDISGATAANLNVTALTQTTYYRVNVSASGNGCNTITSSEAAVVVVPDPVIAIQPTANTTICKNGNTTLSVVASGGSGTFSYQWQTATALGGPYTDIGGATSDTYLTSILPATTYFRVIIANSGSGCNTLTSNVATVFVGDISVQPVAPAPICSGGSATVSVTASANGGTATFSYQWESSANGTSGWSNIGTATSNSYTTPALLTTTYYRCVVKSSTPNCTLTSDVVKVEVIPDPTITTQPSDGTICTGGSYNLSVGATNGTPSLTYQWQSSASLGGTYTDISGATNANYSTPVLTSTSYYRVVVSASGNGCTTITSNPATVKVIADPIISSQPQDGAICVGNNYSFSVVVSGNPSLGALSYQWQTATSQTGPFTDVTDGTGGTTANYTTATFSTTTTRYYRVSIKQGASGCETLSNTVALTISAQPAKPVGSVTQQPSCANATGTISITSPAEGTGFEYSINAGTSYQASSTFLNLTSGVKTITVLKIGATTCVSVGTDFTINNRICASPEVFASINGASGGTTSTVLGSDTLNGNAALLSTVNIKANSTSSPKISLDEGTGFILVAPNTPEGTYTVNYTICEKANLTNCSSTTETVTVTKSIIDAVSDLVVPNVNGFVGRPTAINALNNDKLNGAAAQISQVTISVITPASSINGGPVPTLNIANGIVSVAAGTPESTYTIEYEICEKLNPTNCDRTTIVIPVVAPIIDAINDATSPVNGADGNPNLMDVLTNDTLNGSSFVFSQINLTQISGATPNTPGALVPVLNLANGIISVPVGTPSGTYAINYQICEKLNPSNCDDAVATITVIAATLIANDDNLGPINGYVGNPNVVNAYYINDTFNGKVVDLALITPTILNTAIPVRPGAPVPVLDVATGIVSVPAGTPADDYAIQYQLCEKLNPTNCDVALINIRVLPPPIIAKDDISLPINGRVGSVSVLNAYSNDSLNGLGLNLAEITPTIVTPASPIGGGLVPTLNTSTGVVSVPANTPAGVYTITYRICEKLNPSNCDPATITVNVIAAPIVANDDSVAGINGYIGQTNALDVITNDSLNGQKALLSDISITVEVAALPIGGGSVPTLNPVTGLVSIPAGTTAGDYTIIYKICEKLNPTNCDIATVSITVNPPVIDAVNDSVTNVNGVLGQANVIDAIANDTLNGSVASLSEITIKVIAPAVPQGGNVPVLSTTSGKVNVPPGTPVGTYTIVYQICEKLNPSNCDIATIKVGVGASTIIATNDQAVNINGYLEANAVVNALSNDTVSGLPAQLTNVNLTVVTPATAIGIGNVPVLDVTTGLVNVPAGTSAGSYSIVYQICEKLNPTVCDQATITIQVLAPVIVANDDAITNINGYVGQSNAINAFANDTLNGSVVKTTEIQASVISAANPINGGAVPFMDPTTGQVSIPAGTTAGNYFIDYRICETLNPSNCNDARISITVITPVIVANDDAVNNINGAVGAIEVLDAMANDLLNGQPASLTQTVLAILSPATPINGGLMPALNPATGKVTVAAGTPAGVYTIEYQLCEQLNPSNCDIATITITVDQAPIVAIDDAVSNINGTTGASNVLDALVNDTLNAQLATLAKVNLSVIQAATPINGRLVPELDINTGKVNVPAGTPAGNYIIAYRICEKLNPSNCDDANILIAVKAATIVANNDLVSNVNGYTGANNVINALTNDLLNALAVKPLDVRITVITPPVSINGGPAPTLNLITGNVSVPSKTPAGTYVIGYQICDKLNPTNCDAAKITITVSTAVINAVDDAVTGINGYTGAPDILNVTQNDLLNGTIVIPTEITTTVVTPASSINGGAIPALNTTTGLVSVPAGTTAGVYTIVYRICEKLNPSNCDNATITITVNPPVIEANDDLVGNINGLVGATDVINALTNDNLNGVPMQLAEVNLTELVPATPIGGGPVPVLNTLTGTVSVPAGTPVGSYEIQYRVCEKQNPSNCDDATITINVIAAKIIANDDSATNVDGFLGAANVLNALDNDRLNGNPAQLSAVTMTVVDPALPIAGGQVPVLDPATGQVSVPAGTTAGGYTIVYQICENLNTSNCDTATIKINVGASTIVANNDSVTGINGYVGQANAINAITNDTVGGLPAELKDIIISVVLPAKSVSGGPVPILDTTTGQVSVPAGTPAKTYSITYRICEVLNPTVCDLATIKIEVLAAPIVANDDNKLLPVNGATGTTNAINAFVNDTFNGASLILGEINVTVLDSPTPIPGANVPAFDTATGIVSVPAGTPAGLYSFRYQICEKLNPGNCDDAIITVRVIAAPIEANDDFAININGYVGANNVVNVITNDKLNSSSVALTAITLTVTQPAVSINGGQVPALDTATGAVSVPAGTAKGMYAIEYQICEQLNPSNCDKAIAYISVNSSVIVANNDGKGGINGFVGANNAINAIANDRLNGATINLSQIAITVTQAANPINGGQVPVLNTTTGLVSIPAGTAAGNYVINYQICEVLNPTNCDNASIAIVVVAPVIDAVNDTPAAVNGANNNPNIINVLTNDRLNNSAVVMSQINITQVTPAIPLFIGALVPTLDVSNGNVSAPAGTPAGAYSIEYQICEKLNPANCDIATVLIQVTAAPIDAVDDFAGPINGYVGNLNVVNAFTSNDTFNGATVTSTLVVATIVNPASPRFPGANVPLLDPNTGVVSVPAGTPVGTYTIVYKLCERLNPNNCDEAIVRLQVTAAPIDAVDDTATGVNGYLGNPTVLNAFANDSFNAGALPLDKIQTRIIKAAISINGGPVPVMNTNTGNVSVPANTPSGNYTIVYQICEKLNPTNCDQATILIQVAIPVIDALDDVSASINGKVGTANALNAYNNDTLNGLPLVLNEITRTILSPAVSINGGLVPVLDSVTGIVSVPANTPGGTYTITYKICETLNPLNCDEAVITIPVAVSAIVANDDSVSGINGYVGQTDALDAIFNDTLNGQKVLLSEINTTVVTVATPINGGLVPVLNTTTGLVSIPAGTPAGTYTINYRICEKLNPTNCDDGQITVTVVVPVIDAVNDSVSNINGVVGQANVMNVYTNDTLNGVVVKLSEITSKILTPATPINGGMVPVLNPATGIVTVPAGTPAGSYAIEYEICEILNPANCDKAVATIDVVASTIIANDDSAANINGYVGATAVVNALTNDTVSGLAATLSNVNLRVTQPATAIGSGNVPVLDASTGFVNVPAGTPAGRYTIEYEICQKLNPTVCDKGIITIDVVVALIVANDDSANNINGFAGQANVVNALTNDLLNGNIVKLAEITTTVTKPAGSIGGAPVPVMNTATGQVSVPAGTAAGTYTIEYQICEKLNSSNCDNAIITITVVQANIVANDDAVNNINGLTGAADVLDVISNDLLNGLNTNLTATTLTVITPATPINGGLVPVLDPTTGMVRVPAGTRQGIYQIRYELCEQLNPGNCDAAIATINVIAAAIVANDDRASGINGFVGANNVVDVLSNDTLNTTAVSLSDINMVVVQGATAINGGSVPTLNTTTGYVSVPANTSAGNYTIVYQICEKLNSTNCDQATILVEVGTPVIDAIDDVSNDIDGYVGDSNVLKAYENDKLNGGVLIPSLINGKVISPATPIDGGLVPLLDDTTGVVSVPAGTKKGIYTIVYEICDKLNPMNCDNAVITINVITTSIEASDDNYQIVNGTEGAIAILNVFSNDTFNGKPASIADVNLFTLSSGPVKINPDGTVDVAPGAPSGTYIVNYFICSKLNPNNCDSAKVTVLVQMPTITLIKKGVFVDANNDGFAQPGETIQYTFTVTNSGTMNLSNVVVSDPKVSVKGAPIAAMSPGTVNNTNYAATYVLTQNDINVGKVINQATVKANVEVGNPISNTSDSDDVTLIGKNDPTVTTLKQLKQITLIKGGTLVGSGAVGDKIQYLFTVKNTGNVTVSNIDIDDLMISPNPIIVTPNQLIPGQSGTASATYTVTATDFSAGRVVNSAIVIGDAPDGTPVTDISDWDNPAILGPDDPTIVILTRQPSIALIKTAAFDDNNNDGRAEEGETVTYRFKVTNTGNTPLVNVTVTDPKPGIRVIGDPVSIGIGEANNNAFRAVYVLTAEDIKAGFVENQALAKGTTTSGVSVTDLSDDNSNLEDDPTVLNFDGCNLLIHNAITPNEDGKNDHFQIDGIECFPDNVVQLTNRWGVLVYQAEGYNNKDVAFRGISEGRVTIKTGEQLPSGTYYYVVKYTTYLKDVVTKIGYFYISRQ